MAGSGSVQGDLWGSRAADWTFLQEPMGSLVWHTALRLGQVGNGTRFLDAGCGGGGASIVAAAHGARICGIDASRALVDVARSRLPSARFEVGDLENLPFDDQSFDVALASNSLQYTSSAKAALGEIRRVLAPQGRLCMVQWGPPELCQAAQAIFPALASIMPPSTGAANPLDLSVPESQDQVLKETRFGPIARQLADFPMEYASVEDAWRAQRSAGPIEGACRAVGEPAVKQALTKALQPFVGVAGSVRLQNKFWIVVAAPT